MHEYYERNTMHNTLMINNTCTFKSLSHSDRFQHLFLTGVIFFPYIHIIQIKWLLKFSPSELKNKLNLGKQQFSHKFLATLHLL